MEDPESSQTQERKRGSGVRMVYEMLRNQILDLDLPPGSIVDENQLAERFGMSRTPIREALVRLATEGLIDTLPNRSTMVSQIDFANLHMFFDALTLMYRVTTRLAAEYHTPEDLARIRKLQAAYEARVDAQDDIGMILANRDFHFAIAEAGKNSYYIGLFSRLLDEARRLLRLYYYTNFDSTMPDTWKREHDDLVQAIARRDIAQADALAKAHADQIMTQIHNAISRDRRHNLEL